MTNDADQALLRSAVSEAAANLLGFVPSLGAQEAIGIGEGLPLVARITFSTLPREAIPRSESGARGDGERSLGRGEIVRSAIERWRRATTSQTIRTDEDPVGVVDATRGEPIAQNTLALGGHNGHAPAARPPLAPGHPASLRR
jgi:hypothetical protein